MKIKKIMLISIVLLAVLTVGAVSASDDADFNETLTVEETQEVSSDISFDDSLNDVGEDVLSDGEITEYNFRPSVSSHEYGDADWDPWIVNVHGDDTVGNGAINLTISKDDLIFSDEKFFGEDNDDNNDIIWSLDELKEKNILNEIGTYTISLKYLKDETEIDFGEYDFTLTKFNFNIMGGELYKDYPFEIIKIYDDVDAEVYVNGGDEAFTDDWTLSGLGIGSSGDYNITLVTYEDENVVDNYTFNLNIVDSIDWFSLYTPFNVQSRDLANPVLYLYSPEGIEGNLILNITNDENGFEKIIDVSINSNWMNWTLEELGIEENSGYNVKLLNGTNYITEAWLNVEGIINRKCFNPWVSSYEPVSADWDPEIAKVDVDGNVGEGGINITIIKDDEVVFTGVKYIGENYIGWTLDELRENNALNDAGNYNITLKYVNDETEIDLGEYVFSLTHFEYGVSEGEIYIEYPFDVIRVWDENLNVEVYVDGELTDSSDWTLSGLGIDSLGDHEIRIVADDGEGLVDDFTFTVNVVDEIDWFRAYAPFEIQTEDLENPVLYLYSPNNQIGETLSMFIGDDFLKDVTIESNWMSWNLNDLGIEENENYNVRFENGEGTVSDVWLNVNAFEEQIIVNIWNEDDEGKLYDDYTGDVISVELPEDKRYGNIVVIVDDDEKDNWEIDGNDYNEWSLNDLEITETGEYEVTVKWIVWDEDVLDSEETLAEGLLNVTAFNYDTFRAILDKDSEIIKIYCPNETNGVIYINVQREKEDDDPEDVAEVNCTITDEEWDSWIEFSLKDLGFKHDGDYYKFRISVVDDDEDEVYHNSFGYSVDKVTSDIWNGENVLYLDNTGYVVVVNIPKGNPGRLEIDVDNVKLYSFKVREDMEYHWNLESLNITTQGQYNVTVRFINNDGDEDILCEETFDVVEFENDTARLKRVYNEDDDEGAYHFDLFVPQNSNGVIVISVIYDDGDDSNKFSELEFEINSTYYNKWVNLNDLIDNIDLSNRYYADIEEDLNDDDEKVFRVSVYDINDDALLYEFESDYYENANLTELAESLLKHRCYVDLDHVEVNDVELNIEDSSYPIGSYPTFKVNYANDYLDFSLNDDEIGYVEVPFNIEWEILTVNITSGGIQHYITFDMDSEYVWHDGMYLYVITLGNVHNFAGIPDRAKINFIMEFKKSKTLQMAYLKKQTLQLYSYGGNDVEIEFFLFYENEEDDDENVPIIFNITEPGVLFAEISIPEEYNATDGKIILVSGDKIILSKNLSELERNDDYSIGGWKYTLLFEDFNLTGLNDKDFLNFTVLDSNGKIIKQAELIYRMVDEDSANFLEVFSQIIFDVHYEKLASPSHGVAGSISDGSFIMLDIPEYLNITEGEIVIVRDDTGEVLFNISLSEFDNSDPRFQVGFIVDHQSWEYVINANETIYGRFPENVNMTFSFNYANNSISRKAVRIGDSLYKINTPYDIALLFNVTIETDVICQGEGIAINIIAVDANRQSIYIDLGGGYFEVYINDVKVEDLGRINRWNGETELELFRLTSYSEGTPELHITLEDLDVTENGIYNVKVYHHARGGDNHLDDLVTLLLDQNVTLTSNVKVDDVTSEVFTGFGMDPVLLYLDTYYGEIDDVSGRITVKNSEGNEIFTSNIKSLSKDNNGRYYLKYSDFDDKNFGDKITVMYSDGNERSGNTTVDVTWKDVDSDVFNPVVNDDVGDYYGDFINLDIPDLLTTGQIIVTLKFKGNHTTNLPMNVTSDFGSQAVYRFNVVDIKTNYPDGFRLSLSDLGFYEDDGDYDIDVKFTANGEDTLDVTNNTLNVAFSSDIIISINETLRYTYEVPFACVKVFEPTNAYVDLYIDGVLYSHKTVFEDGLITFTSSRLWTSGNHTAEIRVIHSEFDRLLNSSTVEFYVLTQTEDVNVSISDNVKENEHVIINITVPKAGNVTINGTLHELNAGANTIDLGSLSYGNHTMWVLYEEELDDGNLSFYNNYVSVFVGDDGHWLNVPDPLVLKVDDKIKMNLGKSATGYVLLYLDDKLVANKTLVKGEANFTITDEMFSEDYTPDLLGASNSETKYGKHTYKIVYSGDETHDRLTQTGEFTIAYLFKDDIAPENPLKETYDVTITLPDDATGTVRITVNNKNYAADAKNGKAVIKLENLSMGVNELKIEYLDDDKYPYASYNTELNVTFFSAICDFKNGNRIVTLMLPENATGNLTVYNYNEIYPGTFVNVLLYQIPVVNGKVSVDLKNARVGVYNIHANYEGEDYDVREDTGSFRVDPKVIIKQGVVMGDEGNIYLDLDNATGYVVIAMDHLYPVVRELVNGVVNYTFSTEGYFFGNHSVSFSYYGESLSLYIFNDDKKIPIEYPMLILPQETTGESRSDEDNTFSVTVLDAEGEVASDAKGTITFFVDGVQVAVVEVVNGIASLDISKYRDGGYTISWQYSGDNKYDKSSGSSRLNVNHKVARINAGDLTVVYSQGKAYSVTVYNVDGSLAKGVNVNFLINNKNFKSVKTDAKGIASLLISNAPGNYKITAKALGISVTKNLKVKHVLALKKVNVKMSAKKLVIKATLKKVNGKYLKGKKITLKFNGKKFTAKTNKKGVAKFTIKSKVLKKLKAGKKVKYQATYLKDTVKKSVKVKN